MRNQNRSQEHYHQKDLNGVATGRLQQSTRPEQKNILRRYWIYTGITNYKYIPLGPHESDVYIAY